MVEFWELVVLATPIAAKIVALIGDRLRRAGLERLARNAHGGIHIVDRDASGARLEIVVPPR